MTQSDPRQRLVRLLEEKAFRPVLRADVNRFHGKQRDRLEDMQRRTEQEVRRFNDYPSADAVVTNFKRDLSSEPAKRVHRELKELGLPTLDDVREEFEQLADKLGHRS